MTTTAHPPHAGGAPTFGRRALLITGAALAAFTLGAALLTGPFAQAQAALGAAGPGLNAAALAAAQTQARPTAAPSLAPSPTSAARPVFADAADAVGFISLAGALDLLPLAADGEPFAADAAAQWTIDGGAARDDAALVYVQPGALVALDALDAAAGQLDFTLAPGAAEGSGVFALQQGFASAAIRLSDDPDAPAFAVEAACWAIDTVAPDQIAVTCLANPDDRACRIGEVSISPGQQALWDAAKASAEPAISPIDPALVERHYDAVLALDANPDALGCLVPLIDADADGMIDRDDPCPLADDAACVATPTGTSTRRLTTTAVRATSTATLRATATAATQVGTLTAQAAAQTQAAATDRAAASNRDVQLTQTAAAGAGLAQTQAAIALQTQIAVEQATQAAAAQQTAAAAAQQTAAAIVLQTQIAAEQTQAAAGQMTQAAIIQQTQASAAQQTAAAAGQMTQAAIIQQTQAAIDQMTANAPCTGEDGRPQCSCSLDNPGRGGLPYCAPVGTEEVQGPPPPFSPARLTDRVTIADAQQLFFSAVKAR